METGKYAVKGYQTETGTTPYLEWAASLVPAVQARIIKRIERFTYGNFGDHSPLKAAEGIYEARFTFGPGYRLYFGIEGGVVVILLAGGDKKSQKSDAKKAARFWADYQERK